MTCSLVSIAIEIMSGPEFYVYLTQHGVGAFQNEVSATWCTFKDWVSATGIEHSSRTIYSAIEKRQAEMRVKRGANTAD